MGGVFGFGVCVLWVRWWLMCNIRPYTCMYTHSRAEGPPILLEEISQRQLGQGSVELAAGGHV